MYEQQLCVLVHPVQWTCWGAATRTTDCTVECMADCTADCTANCAAGGEADGASFGKSDILGAVSAAGALYL